jgi:hypothetical protein
MIWGNFKYQFQEKVDKNEKGENSDFCVFPDPAGAPAGGTGHCHVHWDRITRAIS